MVGLLTVPETTWLLICSIFASVRSDQNREIAARFGAAGSPLTGLDRVQLCLRGLVDEEIFAHATTFSRY